MRITNRLTYDTDIKGVSVSLTRYLHKESIEFDVSTTSGHTFKELTRPELTELWSTLGRALAEWQ